MLETRKETINGKEFTITESVLRDNLGELVQKPFKQIQEKGTNRIYTDGTAYDLTEHAREYVELEEMVEIEKVEVNNGK